MGLSSEEVGTTGRAQHTSGVVHGGLPEDMGFHILQTRPTTLREVMESAQNYENAGSALRTSVLKAEKRREKEFVAKRVARRKGKQLDSDSETEENTNSETYDSGSLSEPAKKLHRCKDLRAEREKSAKVLVKVKKEEEESKALKGLEEKLEAIRVLMAKDRKPRKVVQPFARTCGAQDTGNPVITPRTVENTGR